MGVGAGGWVALGVAWFACCVRSSVVLGVLRAWLLWFVGGCWGLLRVVEGC